MINIFLIEAETLVREAFKGLLQSNANFKVIGEAGTGEKALLDIQGKPPNVVLINLNLPDASSIQVVRKLLSQYPDIKVIILSSAAHDFFPRRLLEVGAHGYITTAISPEKLIETIQTVMKGERVVQGAGTELTFSPTEKTSGANFDALSHRETEVMFLVVRGKSISEIAAKLHVSPKTISTYRMQIFRKLNIKSEVELLLLAFREGLIGLDWVNEET